MTDSEALFGAVIADPDADLPRLVLADALEEEGNTAYAQFLRGHVERAKYQPWEPYAVRWDKGRVPGADPNLYRNVLPDWVDGWHVEWDLLNPFRRGLPGAIRVRTLHSLLDGATRLFDLAPIEEIALPTASLDDWRRFAKSVWLPRVKTIRFASLTTPIEPIRCLCESSLATGIEEIYFDKASSPAMPELILALRQSPLRNQLKGLHFRVGYDSVRELIGAFGPEDWPKLESLSFVTMGLDTESISLLADLPLSGHIKSLNISNQLFDGEQYDSIKQSLLRFDQLEQLIFRNEVAYGSSFLSGLPQSLMELDLSHQFPDRHNEYFSHCDADDLFIKLRSFIFQDANGDSLTGILDKVHNCQIVQLDLSGSRLSHRMLHRLWAKHLPQLEWLDLRNNAMQPEVAKQLRDTFGDKVALD